MNSFFMATATVFSLAAPAMNPTTLNNFAIDVVVIHLAKGYSPDHLCDLNEMAQNGKVKIHDNGVVQVTYKTGSRSYSSTNLEAIKSLIEPSEILTEQIGKHKIYHAAWYPSISGGSDANLPEIQVNFDAIDRRNRIILLRDAIHKLREFPEFHNLIAKRIVDLVFKEPDESRKREQIKMILVPLQTYLFNPGIMTHKVLLEGIRVYHQNERRGQRQNTDWKQLHAWENINRKTEMKRWLNSIILSQSLHKMSGDTYLKFVQKAENLGIYVPEGRVKNRGRNQIKFQPRMYVLFGFKKPYSRQEEKIILESGLLTKAYRRLLAEHHPDMQHEYPEVAKFWYQEVQDIYKVLQRRKKNFDKGMIPITEHELYNTRSIQDMFLDKESEFGGYLEK